MEHVIILLIIIVAISFKFYQAKITGKIAEKMVHYKLTKLPEEYYVINNALFQGNGRSTQIDHIVVSPYGVFVIETKGYKGWIFGGEDAESWTQNIYGHKSQFYNPILQNEGHARFIAYLLKDIGRIPIIPIVVFNNDAVLKINVYNHIVINRCNLKKAILRFREVKLSQDTRAKVIHTILSNMSTEKDAIRNHEHNARYRQYESRAKVNNGVCPRCGGQLVERKGKYGVFCGCSNYPKCRFTMRS